MHCIVLAVHRVQSEFGHELLSTLDPTPRRCDGIPNEDDPFLGRNWH